MKIRKILFSLFSTLACMSAAHATPPPPPQMYLGVQGGYADTNFSKGDMINLDGTQIATANIDNHVLGVRGYAGYQWNQYIATEGGYLRVRSTRFTNINDGTEPNGSISEYVVDGRLKVFLPMAAYVHLTPYLQVGVGYLDANSHGGITRDGSTDFGYSFHPELGAGIGYNFTPSLNMDISWTTITRRNTNVPRIDLFFLGLTYRFSFDNGPGDTHNYGDMYGEDP